MLTIAYECSRNNRENLPLPIQTQLSKKVKIFDYDFIAFLDSTLNFEDLIKNGPYNLSISEITDSERHGYLNT